MREDGWCPVVKFTDRKESREDSQQGKGDDDQGMFEKADVKVHMSPDEPPSQPGEKDITEPADTQGAYCTHDNSLDRFPVEPPEHGRRRNGTQEDVKGMKEVKKLPKLLSCCPRILRF